MLGQRQAPKIAVDVHGSSAVETGLISEVEAVPQQLVVKSAGACR
jgi:hypothetical protein